MANEYLTRRFTSTGNLKEGTFSFWLKGRPYDTNQSRPVYLYDGVNLFQMFFERTSGTNPGSIVVYGAGADIRYKGVYRDPSAWSHYLVKVDNTINGAEARFEVYVNGVRLEIVGSQSTSSASYPNRDVNVFNNVFYINGTGNGAFQCCDYFYVDGQALTPDVFGFYKAGKGYISAGSTQATDFRPGQWVPKTPRVIKTEINRRGGFGVNGFYLPMNDSRNFGADFHGDPNSIITLNEKLPQPRVGVATTASVGLGFTDVLRADPYAANLVLALPFVSSGLCTNGTNVGINTGFGDYSHIIRGSGSAKVGINSTAVSIATTASYYGSAVGFTPASSQYLRFPASSDFDFGTGDFTAEFWLWSNPSNTPAFRRWLTTTTGNFSSNTWVIRETAAGGDKSIGNQVANIGLTSSFQRGQWNHIAYVRYNRTESVYVNGATVGIATTSTNYNYSEGATNGLYIGGFYTVGPSEYFDGYMQDLRIYKGVAKYTGGFDVPRPYTPVGIADWRAVPDTTANNFATWNPVSPASDTTFTNGNLTVAYGPNFTPGVVIGTVGIAVTGAGKYYWENRIDASSVSPITTAMIGVWGMSTTTGATNYPGFTNTYGWSYYGESGNFYNANGGINTNRSYGATYGSVGDIIGVALDMTASNGTITFYKNGVSQGVATTGIGTFLTDGKIHAIMPALGDGGGATTHIVSTNFGQNPTFSGNTTAGTFTDSNGKGLFKYQPPSGFLALCEDNLPTPAIADPGKHFKTVLYTGDNADSRSIVGVGFTPDLVWIKQRNSAENNQLQDSVRGATNRLFSNLTSAEIPDTGSLLSFDSNGFSLGTADNYNGLNGTYVAWCWRAGAGTTSTNTNGSITSVVSVNQDAGFSIVSYRGTGANATVGHGLGKVPKFMMIKNRTAVDGWINYHSTFGGTNHLQLNTTAGIATDSTVFNNTSPTSNVFSVGTVTNTNGSGVNLIAYCWAEIEGYSKFGSYVGNGSADGPFVFTNGKPAFVMIKRTDSVSNWLIFDSSRNSTNPNLAYLVPNATDIESLSGGDMDFLSNGFKIRNTSAALNASGGTYIFVAFAESPYTTANAK